MIRPKKYAVGYGGQRFPQVPPAVPRGALGGQCNRKACLATGATWYNTATQRHYCAACARLINEFAQPPICFLASKS